MPSLLIDTGIKEEYVPWHDKRLTKTAKKYLRRPRPNAAKLNHIKDSTHSSKPDLYCELISEVAPTEKHVFFSNKFFCIPCIKFSVSVIAEK
jgi:hypothetical protein